MIFHRHNWNLISKDRIPPALTSMTGVTTHSTADTRATLDAMRENIVYVFKCECGKVKVIKK